ncbi:MAG: metal-dependent transcriptional regulator [Fretibacterium sp.]|nr:metal-dependent transcriptional regulator [Fretibacterium sp.]
MITPRIEDYLEEIFLLESTGRPVTVTELAERLKITKGTVTATVQKLAAHGFLTHERYGAMHLTDRGRRKGLVVFRRHEGLRAFFHELLGLDREKSSEMACSMEHYIDSVTEERLYAMLEFFRRARADRAPWVDEMFDAIEERILLPLPLTLVKPEDKGTLVRLTAEEPDRKKLADMGFVPGLTLTLTQVEDEEYVVELENRQEVRLALNEAATVWLLPS